MKYVFTHTEGRSGSQYLSCVFDGFHEPEPNFGVGNYYGDRLVLMRQVAKENNKELAIKWLRDYKIPLGFKDFKEEVYLETSHFCCKGFLIPLIEILEKDIKVIRLRRDKKAIIESLIRLNTIPAGNWYLEATDQIAIDKMSQQQWSDLTDRQKCEWYVDEIEEQWKKVKSLLKENQIFEVNLEDILQESEILTSLSDFIEKSYIKERIGKVINAKQGERMQ